MVNLHVWQNSKYIKQLISLNSAHSSLKCSSYGHLHFWMDIRKENIQGLSHSRSD